MQLLNRLEFSSASCSFTNFFLGRIQTRPLSHLTDLPLCCSDDPIFPFLTIPPLLPFPPPFLTGLKYSSSSPGPITCLSIFSFSLQSNSTACSSAASSSLSPPSGSNNAFFFRPGNSTSVVHSAPAFLTFAPGEAGRLNPSRRTTTFSSAEKYTWFLVVLARVSDLSWAGERSSAGLTPR